MQTQTKKGTFFELGTQGQGQSRVLRAFFPEIFNGAELARDNSHS